MTDGLTIFVRGLRLKAEIGLHPHERGRVQPLIVDIAVELGPRPVARISDTLDYDRLADAARALAREGHVDLVETYAQRLAERCLVDARILTATVRVLKPEALPDADGAGVEVVATRTRA